MTHMLRASLAHHLDSSALLDVVVNATLETEDPTLLGDGLALAEARGRVQRARANLARDWYDGEDAVLEAFFSRGGRDADGCP